MKTFLRTLWVLLCPIALLAEDVAKAPAAPKKETLSAYRVFVKDGHDAAFKAGVAAHVAKYHSTGWKWRVSEVLSGPDGGAYMVTEGPYSWTELDGRGDLGPEHQKDYDANITPHVEKTTPMVYQNYMPELSTVAPGAFAPTKTLISHVFVKPGRASAYVANLQNWKKVWEKRGLNMGVWSSFFSGETSFTLVFRLKNGWKDFDEDGISNRKAADEIFGPGGYDRLQDENARDVARSYGEMIAFRADLSSK